MQDFNLHAPEGANRRKRIVGRGQGCGRGTTSGRGNKGQKARSGGRTYVGFEGGQMPLYRRLARRGFSNYPFKKTWQIVNVGDIEKRFNDGDTVDTAALHKCGLVKGNDPIKILGAGVLTRKLKVNVPAVSASAKDKIVRAGGEVIGAETVKEKAAEAGDKAETAGEVKE